MRSRLFALIPVAFFAVAARAGELPSPETPIPQVVDQLIGERLQTENVTPSQPLDDAGYLRRVTLDLAGRIPTTSELLAFRETDDPNKSEGLVDRLLASPDFAFHQRNQLDNLLAQGKRTDRSWREYLLQAARENRPWDRMFQDMLLADVDEQHQGATEFLKSRIDDRNAVTNDVSSLFFGVNISCAQCHDHPLVADWKQDHFFGMAAFFERTYLTKKDTLAERGFGEVKFRTIDDTEKTAEMMFLTGKIVESPVEWTKEKIKADEEEYKRQRKDKDAPPPEPPPFSAREALVELALAPEGQRYFARAIVNRVWGRLLGHPIVNPPDQMHSDNPPSHPELLDWLARDLVENGYDLKRLIRGIVLSETYARSSRWTGDGELPAKELFAVGLPRALTPRQYGVSLIVASANPEQLDPADTEEWAKKREQFENASNRMAGLLEVPTEHFQVGVDEALYFSNNSNFENDALRDSGDRLVGYLKGIEDRDEQIEKAFLAVLSRTPDEAEAEAFRQYLAEREDRPLEGLKQAVWALLTGPELRFNH